MGAPRAMNHAARTGIAMSVLRRRQRPWRPQLRRRLPSLPRRLRFALRFATTIDGAVRTTRHVSRWTARATGATAALREMTAATGLIAKTARVGMAATTIVTIDLIGVTGTSGVRRSVLCLSSELKPVGWRYRMSARFRASAMCLTSQ